MVRQFRHKTIAKKVPKRRCLQKVVLNSIYRRQDVMRNTKETISSFISYCCYLMVHIRPKKWGFQLSMTSSWWIKRTFPSLIHESQRWHSLPRMDRKFPSSFFWLTQECTQTATASIVDLDVDELSSKLAHYIDRVLGRALMTSCKTDTPVENGSLSWTSKNK